VLDQGVDTSAAAGRMFFQILVAIAEFEHAGARAVRNPSSRRARPRSRRPCTTSSPTTDGRRAHTVQQIADEFGVTRPTIYRHLQRHSE